MSEQDEQSIIFEPKLFYLKNSLFEGKRLPEIFFQQNQIEAAMSINIDYKKVGDNEGSEMWNVSIALSVEGKDINNEESPFYKIHVDYAGIFEIGNYEENEIGQICRVHCANMIFPYAREELLNKVIKSGVPQITIKPINFSELYKSNSESQQNTEE